MESIVIISVDTEFSSHPGDIGITGHINGKNYGVPLLSEILNQHNMKATFFVDVYTEKKEFVPKLIDVGRQLKRDGHDLQLHTHPNGMFDPRRYGMHEYTLNEQTAIIKRGKELFWEWFQEYPVAHRAGDWAADYNTLRALKENNILTDSSMFYGWPACKLNQPPLTKNIIKEYEGMLEVPASVFKCRPLKIFSPYRLISTDGNSFDETWALIEILRKESIPIISLVYHSFSFLKWDRERTKYSVNHHRIKKFERLVKELSQSPSFQVKTIKVVQDLNRQSLLRMPEDERDFLPQRGYAASLERLIDRATS